ncbi:hypothetical protein TWF281_009723 [Arthrobotrys megalospora]
MNDWRALGYVPDSEGEDDSDILLSPPRVVEETAKAGTRLLAGVTNDGTKEGRKRDELDIFDVPPSSVENEGPSEGQRRGRGRPPKRGKGAKRLSVGGSLRPKKQARIEEPVAEAVDETNAPGTPIGRSGGIGEASSPYPSSGNRSLLNLFSTKEDGDTTLDTNFGATSSIRTDISLVDAPASQPRPTSKRPDEDVIEEVDLIDEHGPDSDLEDAPMQPLVIPLIPPSSPPVPSRILPTESAINSPALPSRILLVDSEIHSPAPPTPVSISSNLEVRIPVFSHTGLTDPATRIHLDSAATNSDESIIPPDEFTSGVARNLRARKPIQVNPYQLEAQRYHSDWKSRGLKPIRYIYNDHILPSNKNVTEKDSQEDEWVIPEGEEEETQAASLRQTQSFQSLDQDSMDTGGQQSMDGDEELLALDELFRRSAKERPPSPGVRSTANGKKRQKTNHLPGKSAKSKRIIEAAKAALARSEGLAMVPEDAGLPVGQPAPRPLKKPAKGTKKSRDQVDIFDLNSSDSGSDSDSLADKPPASTSRRPVILDSDESGGDTTPRAGSPTRRRLPVSSSSESEDEEEESPNDPELREHEIQMYQRKVRGVLPASWVRFNRSGGQENRKPVNVHQSPEARPMVKGMAQMRIRARNSPPAGSMANPVNLGSSQGSDDDSDDDIKVVEQPPESSPIASSAKPFASAPVPSSYSRRSYAFEDHGFDRMLSRSRGPNSGTKSKNKPSKSRSLRQSRLSDGFSNSHGTGRSRNPVGPSKPRRKPVALSVVDACKLYRKTKSTSPPQFMRIAERLAKKRKDSGRHLPDRKVVQIDRFFEDETDGEDTLARWKKVEARDTSSLDIFSRPEEASPSNFKLRGAQSSSSKLPSIHERQPTYLQTKLASYRLQRESTPRPNQKSRLKSQVMAKPIALLPPPIHKRMIRMDDVIQHLGSKTIDDPIEDVPDVQGPQFPTLQLQQPTSYFPQPRLFSHHPPQRKDIYTANENSKLFKNGKQVLPQKRKRHVRKISAPRRIERNPPPIAFQPPERQPIELPDSMDIDTSDGKTLSFENMGRVGTTYSRDFDIKVPDKERALFHVSTFIGNGNLERALRTDSGKTYRSGIRVQNVEVLGRLLEWDVYEEVVAEQLESCLSSVLGKIEQLLGEGDPLGSEVVATVLEMRKFFRYVVDYLSAGIFFSDLIDIGTFASRYLDIFSDFTSKIESFGAVSQGELSTIFRVQLFAYTSLLIRQVSCIAERDAAAGDKTRLQDLRSEILGSLISLLTGYGTWKLCQGFSPSFQNVFSADRLNEQAICLEGWVIAYHVSLPTQSKGQTRDPSFWDHVNASIGLKSIKTLKDINVLDVLWRDIFRLIPLSAVDAKGNLSPFEDDAVMPDNWGFVKELMVQSLTIYNSSGLHGRIRAKDYIRALFARCLALLRDWRWGRPEIIIVPLYDFFGKRLQNLTDEKEPKDPEFLAHLDEPSFASTYSEMCFPIFLKIVALGMGRMKSQGAKGLSDLVIRLIPNHGRVFLKEENSAQADVDTLANHHYLLTTLYYGASRDMKKRVLGIVRRLVDPEKSHAAVCGLSLRTWANILICELTVEKNHDLLEELMKWHAGIVQTTARMHRENDIRLEQEKKKIFDLNHVTELEANAKKNKREVESLLSSAMALLKMVFKKDICDFYSAEVVLGAESLKTIYGMASCLPGTLVATAVGILSSHIKLCQDFGFSSTKDDSQETWAGFDDVESEGVRKEAAKKLLDDMYDPLFGLINSYFAAQEKHLDEVLKPCVLAWIELGSLLVQCGLKTWDDYFNAYRKSWFSMIETDNKRAYSVFYVTNIIKIDPSIYDPHKTQILELWAQSLVERDSLLKFQHELTTVLFNHDLANGLFSNMPFEVNEDIEQYVISQEIFKQRRLSLLGTLLENMQREMIKVSDAGDQLKARVVKTQYVSILQELMNAMRKNYMAIYTHQNTTSKVSNTTATDQQKKDLEAKKRITDLEANRYVGFCQQVVEFLQQYTTDICAIDKFFVDSVIFPLPTNDPTYVASKLKGYFLRLKAERKGWFIQFLQFWQNTVGRVAVEKQQGYFVGQILAAFDVGERWVVEEGKGERTLREFCLIAMFGSYIRRCLTGVGNLVVAVPVLGVVEMVVKGLVLEFDGVEEGREVDGRISGLLVAVLEAVGVAIEEGVRMRESAFNEPLALYVLELLVRIVGECDYIVNLLHLRVNHVSEELPQDLLKIAVRGLSRLKARFMGRTVPEKLDLVMFEADLPFQAERRRFDSEYTVEMEKWRVDGGELFVKRAAVRKKVEWRHLVPEMGAVEGKRKLVERIEGVLGWASAGVCEGVVREAGERVKKARPFCKWADELLGIKEREGGVEVGEVEFFDMDD